MRIVVLDGYTENPGDLSWEELEQLGELTVYDRTADSSKIIERIGTAEVVYTNKTSISKGVFKACPELKFIGVLATGYDVVDIEAAKAANVVVSNVPSYGTDAVAQYTIALLLELCHYIGEHSDCVKKGDWNRNKDWCFWNHPLIELSGKTMGIVGFGRIGYRTGVIAQALGMKVLAFDSHKRPEWESTGCRYVEWEELLSASDVISLHCPLFPSTNGMINRSSIEKMKDGVLIINDSRGGLIVEEDLRDALNSDKVAGAAVDVVSSEPIQMNNPLLHAKNIIITPHIAWASKESRERLMNIAVGNMKAYMAGHPVNVVS